MAANDSEISPPAPTPAAKRRAANACDVADQRARDVGDDHDRERPCHDPTPVEAVRGEGHRDRRRRDAEHLGRGHVPGRAVVEAQVLHHALHEAGLHDEHLGTHDPEQDGAHQ